MIIKGKLSAIKVIPIILAESEKTYSFPAITNLRSVIPPARKRMMPQRNKTKKMALDSMKTNSNTLPDPTNPIALEAMEVTVHSFGSTFFFVLSFLARENSPTIEHRESAKESESSILASNLKESSQQT
ncbi:MAG: hypothetical protein H0V70_14450 [Ktedonobacteraceae bacterium]|nr:hypothetical protein [Ktedonobacteraceae bacterium]